MTDDVQSPMEDAARDLVDADPGWRYAADAIMNGVSAMIDMRGRLDRAAALEAGLRELVERIGRKADAATSDGNEADRAYIDGYRAGIGVVEDELAALLGGCDE